MATLDPKTNVCGLNRSKFHQKHKYYITKPNQPETAAKVEKTPTFYNKIDEKSLFPQSVEVLTPCPSFSMDRRSS